MDLLFAVDAVPLGSFTRDGGLFLNNVWLIPTLPAVSFFLILFFGKRLKFGGAEIGITAVGLALLLASLTNISWWDHRDHFDGDVFSARTGQIDVVEGLGSDTLELGAGAADDARNTTIVVDGVEESVQLAVDAAPGEIEAFGSVGVLRVLDWFENGGIPIEAGTLADGPSVIMLFVVTAVSLLVHIYSTDYVAGDRRYTHYFAFLSLSLIHI